MVFLLFSYVLLGIHVCSSSLIPLSFNGRFLFPYGGFSTCRIPIPPWANGAPASKGVHATPDEAPGLIHEGTKPDGIEPW